MRTKNTFGIIFFIRKPKSKKIDAKSPVYVKITVDGKSTELSLKHEIERDNWDGKVGMAKGKSEEIRMLNVYLEEVHAGLVECMRELRLNRKLVTAEAVKKLFLGEEEKEHSLLNVFEYHNTEMEKELEYGTQKNYYTTKKYIEKFLKMQHRTSDIYLSQLNYKFITDFEKFVKENPINPKKRCTQNGTMKHIERLKKVVNLAVKNEWLYKDPFQKYSSHFIKKDRGFLTFQELDAVESKQLRIERLQLVKDLFVFSCYTGLAYVDVMRLTPKDMRLGIDGEYWLYFIRKKNKNKTMEEVRIPLLPKALTIIEKYRNEPNAINQGRLFPALSNQRVNSYLKEIGDISGIEKDLTFHLARHTFATTVTLTNGVPLETVSKLLGHTSIKTTQIYAKVIEQKVSNDMRELRSKLSESKPRLTGTENNT